LREVLAPIQRIERGQRKGRDDEERVARRVQHGLPPAALAGFAKHLPRDHQHERPQGEKDAPPSPHLVHVKAVAREQPDQP
jgi:hypothetical protein